MSEELTEETRVAIEVARRINLLADEFGVNVLYAIGRPEGEPIAGLYGVDDPQERQGGMAGASVFQLIHVVLQQGLARYPQQLAAALAMPLVPVGNLTEHLKDPQP